MAEPVQVERRPALAGIDRVQTTGVSPNAAVVRILEPRARFVLRADSSVLPEGGNVAGFRLWMGINHRTASGQRVAMRLGPDEWQLSGPQAEAGPIAGALDTALAGQRYSLVDVGHSRIALAVSGVRAMDVLNSGCPLDLSATAFPTGRATRTLLGKCEVILARTDDTPTFEIECGRSLGAYLHDFLLEAVHCTAPLA
jgi:sarcosine oxidase, subunit gamma